MKNQDVKSPIGDEKKEYTQKLNEWYFDSETDEIMGIETFRYDNGGVSKRCKLSDGRQAVCHRLKGKDNILVKRLTNGDSTKNEYAVIALSTKIDDKGIVMEDIDQLWYNDFTMLGIMATSINFM